MRVIIPIQTNEMLIGKTLTPIFKPFQRAADRYTAVFKTTPPETQQIATPNAGIRRLNAGIYKPLISNKILAIAK